MTTSGAEADIELVELPRAAPTPHDPSDVGDTVARARAAYESGDYEQCLATLTDEGLLGRALDGGDREGASRVLWWRAACGRAASGPEAAREPLEHLTTLDLPRPSADVEAVAASLELQLADLRGTLAERPRIQWTLRVERDARVWIDGAEHPCTAPCEVDVWPGLHHLRVEADGRVAQRAWVDVADAPVTSEITLQASTPERAAGDWRLRYTGEERESDASLALLRRALRAESLLLVLSDARGQLRGIYATVDGIQSRAERLGVPPPPEAVHGTEFESAVHSLLFELTPWAAPEPWWESPWPWIIGGILLTGAAVGLTYYYVAPIEGSSVVRVRVSP